MKKFICLFLFLSFLQNIFCQEVIINGSNKYRLLTWDDFTGKPDKNSPYQALTFWGIFYGFKGVNFIGDTAKLTGFSATLKLDENKSWIKEDKQTASLLKHEQGHFDIGLICQQEIIKQINSATFLKSDFQNKVKTIFSITMEKYRLMQLKYDAETNHSQNQQNQNKWNDFIAKALQQ